MKIWAFDENRADFVEVSSERMTADPAGCYIIRRGDDVLVCEHGQERPMPERLTVAGVPFDREQFEDVHTRPLRAEMEQDGQLQARNRGEVSLPLELPIWVTKGPQDEPCATSCSGTTASTPSSRLKNIVSCMMFWKQKQNRS